MTVKEIEKLSFKEISKEKLEEIKEGYLVRVCSDNETAFIQIIDDPTVPLFFREITVFDDGSWSHKEKIGLLYD